VRSLGRDIVELFGHRPNDLAPAAVGAFTKRHCPFSNSQCSKTNHDKSLIYGVCSVTNGVQTGAHNEVIVCPKRLYANNYGVFADLVKDIWGPTTELVVGGPIASLRERAARLASPAIAFGQGSGTEISVDSNGQMSMDWVIQLYANDGGRLRPRQFIGIEVQSIDITGNYRDTWAAYEKMKVTGQHPRLSVVASGHGLNWANVHKRLIPQIIRKGNVYRGADRCAGFYFLLPEIVYRRFEQVIGPVPDLGKPGRDRLSVKTYSLGPKVPDGQIRGLTLVRTLHLDAVAVAQAFIANVDLESSQRLNARMMSIL
jgi:hypothetical protein